MENRSNLNTNLGFEFGRAICYSGYRDGQSPDSQTYPSYEEIKEDLLLLSYHWKYLRLYDCSKHAELVLDVIQKEELDLKIMLGAYIGAEMNNFGCPWGGVYTKDQLSENRKRNKEEIRKLIKLANSYPEIICSLSAGNEATVDWTDHFVPVEKVIEYVQKIKRETNQPVTFCENYVPWLSKLKNLAKEVDFISIHTYPVWEDKSIHDAMEYTRDNFFSVSDKYPEKPVIITEAGWATNSNGRGIDPENVSEDLQKIYYKDLMEWSESKEILTFVFEAFDEPWKGSPEENEPEKHWGLFTVERKPKKVMRNLYTKKAIKNILNTD